MQSFREFIVELDCIVLYLDCIVLYLDCIVELCYVTQEKEKAWIRIVQEFNAQSSTKRNVESLKNI
jgi:hypothetical protein